MSLILVSIVTWRIQLILQPLLLNIENWEGLNIFLSENPDNKGFIKNMNIVAYVLSGHSLKETAKKFNVKISRVHYLLKRTLATNSPNEKPKLTMGLIPYKNIKKATRKKKLSRNDDGVGFACSFQHVLENTKGLRKHLDKLLKNYIKRKPFAENLTPYSFHKHFLNYLKLRNWSETTYPFNTDSKGYESCRRYFHKRLAELKMPKPKISKIIHSPQLPIRAFQEVQLDAYMMDVETSVIYMYRGREVQLRVSRITLYIARDKATGCILAYNLSHTKHPNRYDVLKLLTNIHSKWEPMKLTTPGLEYTQGACLPGYLGEIYQSIGIGTVCLDNAMSHFADVVKEHLTINLATTVNWGLPGTPEMRHSIEQLFKDLLKYWHKHQSTTGSHVRDPKKETKKNRKSPPVLTIQALEEIVSVVLTNENVTPKEFLGSKSPIEALKEDVQKYPLWINFNESYKNKNPFVFTKVVPVKTIKHENRTPHINFMKMRYKGACLIKPELIGKKIIIKIDSRDIRSLEAITTDGEFLGIIKCPLSWQIYPLSLASKQYIMKLVRRKIINSADPMSGYFIYLLENSHLPHIALELYKLIDHSKLVNKELIEVLADDLNDIDIAPDEIDSVAGSTSEFNIPDWNTDLINDSHLDEGDSNE